MSGMGRGRASPTNELTAAETIRAIGLPRFRQRFD